MSTEITNTNPHILLTDEVLRKAVKNDLGKHWKLQNFKIKDFTKKGDNYASTVTSVSCTATCDGKKRDVFYVAKLNPFRKMQSTDEAMNDIFIREGLVFTDIAIKLNDILQSIKHPKINFPECIYYNFEKRQEIILSKDLRQNGYKMLDRKIGIDIKHSQLLIKELAKLHASSHIFKSRLPNKSVIDIYPFLKDVWAVPGDEGRTLFDGFLKFGIDTSIKLLQEVKEYAKQCEWLINMHDQVGDIYFKLIEDSSEKMSVICHGDCWNNNVVFRYNEEGIPQGVTLLDFQFCRYASLGLDLNYFFYTSLTGDIRKRYRDHFLSVYFQEFSDVITAANMKMPFTEDEFRKEIEAKVLFGIISGLMVTPVMFCESEDAIDLNDMRDGQIEEFMKEQSERINQSMSSNPLFKDRFLAILDDVLKLGLMEG